MQNVHPAPTPAFRMRVAFADGEDSFAFPAGATLGDIADWIDGVSELEHRTPVAIAITMSAHHGTRRPILRRAGASAPKPRGLEIAAPKRSLVGAFP